MKPLNPSQMAAVRHGKGPMMVLAGPGSGKTTVIIHRINTLITELRVNPRNILVITFTKAATEEMRKRFIDLAGGAGGGVTFSTFHALFYRVIRERSGLGQDALISDGERREAIKRALASLGVEADEETLQSVSLEISLLKNELIDADTHNASCMGVDEFRRVVRAYEGYKDGAGKIDFDDMLVKCHEIFTSEPGTLQTWRDRYPYILVDEFQDICLAQYKCVRLLAGADANLFIVGDDDQSIYRFRGARPEFLLQFPKDFPQAQQAVLDTNYRSTDQVIQFCNKVIVRNKARYPKVIVGTNKTGPVPAIIKSEDANAEAVEIGRRAKSLIAKGCPPHEIAVIYRVNIQSRALTDAFMNLNVPYRVKDEAPSIYEHWISKDIYSYLRLSYDSRADNCCLRILNKPKRYIGGAAIEMARRSGGGIIQNLYTQKQLKTWQLSRIEELAGGLGAIAKRGPSDAIKYIRRVVGYNGYLDEYSQYRKLSPSGLYEVLDELQEAAKPFHRNDEFTAHMENAVLSKNKKEDGAVDAPGVLFTTMHSAKGLEFECVFLAGAVEGYAPHEKSKTEAALEEERRLFYVGLTRAKRFLCVSFIKKRHEAPVEPTRFLDGLV